MAIQIPIITEFQDNGLKSAKAAFANFKTQVGDAEGAMGKFKAGAGATFDYVKANAGLFAATAGAAIGGFALKAHDAFQDLALQAGKFADATGLAVDDASRWIEVAGDIGVEAGTVESGIGKMNKALGNSPALFKTLGVEIGKTKNGATDVNKTFLNVIDRLNGITDPAERARVASQLLGKGWQEMAELIAQGSDELAASLAQVSDAAVISPRELAQAREYRATTDRLSDSWRDFTIQLGQRAAPAIQLVADSLAGWTLGDRLKELRDNIGIVWTQVANVVEGTKKAAYDTAFAFEQMQLAFDNLKADITGDISLRNLERQMIALQTSAAKAFGGTREDLLNFENDVDQVRLTMLAMAENFDLVSQKRLMILVERGDLEAAWALIQNINRGIGATAPGVPSGMFLGIGGGIQPRADGGPVTGGRPYIVGENGPELFVPGMSGGIIPNSGVTGGGNVININMPAGSSGDDIVRALQNWTRRNGSIPIPTTTQIRR